MDRARQSFLLLLADRRRAMSRNGRLQQAVRIDGSDSESPQQFSQFILLLLGKLSLHLISKWFVKCSFNANELMTITFRRPTHYSSGSADFSRNFDS
jgi:hypothetical protein